jgi:cold shock CspA family protein
MPDYPNPYEFVPLESTATRSHGWNAAKDGIERWHGDRYSGRFRCVLHPETPLFMHDEGQQAQPSRRFARRGNRPVIAASSLKGALRSIYEIVSDGCLSSLSEEYAVAQSHIRTYGRDVSEGDFRRMHPTYTTNKGRRVPEAYRPCEKLEHACPGCRLFGMVEQTQAGQPLAGRLLFSDATPVQTQFLRLKLPGAGGGPHPWHSTFYFEDAGRGPILGRKLYFHHRSYRETIALYGDGGRAGLIELDAQLGDFEFTVDFINLAEEELDYLAYTLLLEDRLRHHLGYGKPYGLGSARITVKLELWQQPDVVGTDRFLRWDAAPGQATDATALRDKGLGLWLARPNSRPAYDNFIRILAWPGANPYKYPTFQWFRQTEGSGEVTLAEYQRGVRSKAGKPAGGAPPPPPPPGQRQRGVVKTFFADKGFGFIQRPGQQDLFVHIRQVQGGQLLRPGQQVEFTEGAGQKGPQAQDVRPV